MVTGATFMSVASTGVIDAVTLFKNNKNYFCSSDKNINTICVKIICIYFRLANIFS